MLAGIPPQAPREPHQYGILSRASRSSEEGLDIIKKALSQLLQPSAMSERTGLLSAAADMHTTSSSKEATIKAHFTRLIAMYVQEGVKSKHFPQKNPVRAVLENALKTLQAIRCFRAAILDYFKTLPAASPAMDKLRILIGWVEKETRITLDLDHGVYVLSINVEKLKDGTEKADSRVKIYPDGLKFEYTNFSQDKDGTMTAGSQVITYPDGRIVKCENFCQHQDGSVRAARRVDTYPGSDVLTVELINFTQDKDGTMTAGSRVITYLSGRKVEFTNFGETPDGSVTGDSQVITYPDGRIVKCENFCQHQDGSVRAARRVDTYPDGRTVKCEKFCQHQDGSVKAARRVDTYPDSDVLTVELINFTQDKDGTMTAGSQVITYLSGRKVEYKDILRNIDES